MPPTLPQLALTGLATILFAGAALASLLRGGRPGMARWTQPLAIAATAILAVVLAWHAFSRGRWIPLGDNFEALLWLAILLSLVVGYLDWGRHIGGLDWFILPIIVLLLLGAVFFGKHDYQQYGRSAWVAIHSITAYGGAVAFAVAAAGGAMYVLVSRRLRRKALPGPSMPSLERLERITMAAVTLGFAMLSVGLVTGIMRMLEPGHPTSHTKVLLSCLSWLVYAVVLHAPINPRFRGRKAAMLSIFGFVLMIGTLVAVQYMPTVPLPGGPAK